MNIISNSKNTSSNNSNVNSNISNSSMKHNNNNGNKLAGPRRVPSRPEHVVQHARPNDNTTTT